MPENPLLPNAELQALLAHTKRCITLDRAARRRATNRAATPLPFREALLAGTTLQRKPGDLVIPEPGDKTITAISPEEDSKALVPDLDRNTPHLLLAAAAAATLQQSSPGHFVLTFSRERAADPNWPDALAWAQQHQLPLIIACADPRGPNAFGDDPRAPSAAFSWKAVKREASRIQLPILTIDGEDAVAVYRSMQESILRARAGGGPALIWAMLPDARTQTNRARSQEPLGRLQRYLRSRKIPF